MQPINSTRPKPDGSEKDGGRTVTIASGVVVDFAAACE
jgi:hypothetical protein